MSRFFALVVLVAFAGWALFAQAATSAATQISPEDVLTTQLYSVFASEIVRWDKLADRGDAQGKNASASRHHFKDELTLTDGEEATLKANMHACADSITASQTARKALVDEFRSQNPAETKLSQAMTQQLQQNYTSRLQGILTCVQDLRSGLGPATFQKVDHYVRTTVRSRVTIVPKGGSAK